MGRVNHCSNQYIKHSRKKKLQVFSRSETVTDQVEKKREVEVATLFSKNSMNMQTL